MTEQVPLPILIAKEKKWFVASCPMLDIATQGKTEKEVKENMVDLINEYLSDPDTAKPSLEDLLSLSLTNVTVKIPEGVLCHKTQTSSPAKSN
jgi:predicted RNase H-like HicB family nuclease